MILENAHQCVAHDSSVTPSSLANYSKRNARPVPASTHVAALDRCTFQGLTTGRVSVSGHGITAPPARDLPEPSLSMLAYSHRRNTRTVPADDAYAAAAVTFPELDGITLAILGLHTCLSDTVLHMSHWPR
jgi:hypothetical protein